jgi:hypothetical protein
MYMDNWRPGGTDWIVRCMDPSQVTDLLSRAYTCLWGREDLFLSCHEFWIFLDRLFRVVIYIRLRMYKHHTEIGPTVLGAYSPSLDGDLDPLTGVEQVGLACARGTSKTCVFGAPNWAH